MPAANTTFVQLCSVGNIPSVPANQRLQVLQDAAITSLSGLSAKQLTERCAALSWARDSIQNSVDPDTWPALLSPALSAYLQGLYLLPPHKGTQPAPSLHRRLAEVIALYTLEDGAANPPPNPPAASTSAVPTAIGAGRPDHPNRRPIPHLLPVELAAALLHSLLSPGSASG